MAAIVVTTLLDENDAGATAGAPGGAGLSLREALAIADTQPGNDTILFDDGLSGTIRLTSGTLAIAQGVLIDGDGRIAITGDAAGNDITGPGAITDIAASGAARLADNVRVLDIAALAPVTLQGLVITGGRTTGDGEDGGGIRSQSDVMLIGSTLAGNSTSGYAARGGGVFTAADVTLNGSTVSGNATSGYASAGGGVWANGVALDSATVSGNTTTGTRASGGGIFAVAVTGTAATIDGNSTAGEYGTGGGIRATEITLAASTVSGNATAGARAAGGGLWAETATLTNATLAGNTTLGNYASGGALYGARIAIINSTLTGNTTAGLYAPGGAIYGNGRLTNPYGGVTLTNSIVIGNAAAQSGGPDIDIMPFDLTLNGGNILGTAVYSGSLNVGSTNASAVFASIVDIGGGILAGVLAGNGGPVQTVALNAGSSNPALDASDTSAPTTDARGTVRYDDASIANANGDASDLGAFEVQPTATAEPDSVTTPEDTVLNGNVLLANGGAPDSGGPLTVVAVNGSSANVGSTIVLPSGAHLTLAADGTFTYDPHGAFDALPDFAASGAANVTGGDSFTYTLGGGSTATVTVTLRGVDSNDLLLGTAGSDTLDGGIGNDTMQGGAGDDTYIVDTQGDRTTEGASAGADTVFSAVNRTLGANLEHLTLTGAAVTGNGNTLDNRVTGNAGANRLSGDEGNDTLIGAAGDDELRGAAGDDSMQGGTGSDRYFVNTPGDIVDENGGTGPAGGNDTVYSQISCTLGVDVEVLRLQASGPLSGTGNSLANRIFGNTGDNLLLGLAGNDSIEGGNGADTLEGGEGNDTLIGGAHADVFRFATSNAGVDRILEFSKNGDRFDLSGGTFTAISTAANGDTVLTHAGGFIRIAAPPALTLAQWNALVLPAAMRTAPEGAAPGQDEAFQRAGAIMFEGCEGYGPGRLHSELITLARGDWVFA